MSPLSALLMKRVSFITESLPPPPGQSGGIWGSSTYVGPCTWALAIATIPTIVRWMIILLFCPVDKRDVYKADGKLYAADGKFYKIAKEHNFHIAKSEHVVGSFPPTLSADILWGTTQHVGPLTWSVAIAALPTVLGFLVTLLFVPLDNDDVYKDGGCPYLADGHKFKAASGKNFDLRRSAHTVNGCPKGVSGGTWGTSTYVGPLTLSLAIAGIPTIVGPIIILLFCPVDTVEVYNADGKLNLPCGTVFKAVTKNNFCVCKAEHTEGAPKGMSGGEWFTTTYVGPLTWSLALISILSGVGWIAVLLILPLDSKEVYKVDDKLYLPDGALFTAASTHNYYKHNSKHVQVQDTEAVLEKE